jgi:O-methyltransferase involved in polyketide biosynthesis
MNPVQPAADSHRFEGISYTARKILQQRACYTSIPFAREVAEAAGVRWRMPRLRALAQSAIWGPVLAGPYLQYRHDAIARAMAVFPRNAVLELAAGFGPRGLAESAHREAYIESDLPNVIDDKLRIVKALSSGAHQPNHYFIALNACSTADMEEAAKFVRGLRLGQPLVIVNEGILMYLDSAEQRLFRDNIKALLSLCSPQGVWITPDFSERDREGGLMQSWMTRRLTQTVQRPVNRFRSDEDVSEFLAAAGLLGEKQGNPMQDHADRRTREVAELFRAWTISFEK